MISLPVLLAFVAACALLAATPGPSMSLLVANTTSHGTKAGLWTVFGNSTGLAILIIAVIFGLGAIMTFVAQWFDVIRVLGAVYLIWLGISRLKSSFKKDLDEAKPAIAHKNFFFQGALVAISNPKVLLFLGAFFPQFLDTQLAMLPQLVILGIGFLITIAVVDSGLVIMVGTARNALNQSRLRLAEQFSGVGLILGGIWLATMKR